MRTGNGRRLGLRWWSRNECYSGLNFCYLYLKTKIHIPIPIYLDIRTPLKIPKLKNTLYLFLLFNLTFVYQSTGQEGTFLKTYDFEGEYYFGGGLQAALNDENIIISNIWTSFSGEENYIQVMTLSATGEVLQINNSGLSSGI